MSQQEFAITFTTGAVFSDCGRYRYKLWRLWSSRPYVLFLMLNPSTATAEKNDPTVERCQRYATAWKYGGLHVCNIFALRSTDPMALYDKPDPIGPGNDDVILEVAHGAGQVVCAWGNHGKHLDRSRQVIAMLQDAGIQPYCLTVTGTGEPGHPLYLRKDIVPRIYERKSL